MGSISARLFFDKLRQCPRSVTDESWLRYALGGTRTHDPGIRNPLLYPAELRAQMHGLKDGKINLGWREVNWGREAI
jgi:hypothetical protein